MILGKTPSGKRDRPDIASCMLSGEGLEPFRSSELGHGECHFLETLAAARLVAPRHRPRNTLLLLLVFFLLSSMANSNLGSGGSQRQQ